MSSKFGGLIIALVCACVCCMMIVSSSMGAYYTCTRGSLDPKDYDADACFNSESLVPGVSARYVRLQATRKDYLNVSEIIVVDETGKNCAIGKTVNSSSVFGDIAAKNATSGLGTLNMAHTKNEIDNEYLEVDLGEERMVQKVIVLNRGDCCKERIKGCFVTLSDKDKTELARSKEIEDVDEAYVWASDALEHAPSTLKYSEVDGELLGQEGIKGQFVKIMQTRKNVVINLNALGVFTDDTTNVARDKTVTANSVHPAGPMKKLTELNETDKGHFAHTNGPANVNDWMLCDLGEEFKIKAITLVNRKDCCQDRAVGIQVQILDKDKKPIVTTPKIAENHPAYRIMFVSDDECTLNEWCTAEGK